MTLSFGPARSSTMAVVMSSVAPSNAAVSRIASLDRQGRTTQLMPVCRPDLPKAAALIPYLQSIDSSGWYSNGGPLVQQLEARLAQRWGADPAVGAVTASNATSGLVAALLAATQGRAALCMVPAWTFAASAHAIRLAGLTPWI